MNQLYSNDAIQAGSFGQVAQDGPLHSGGPDMDGLYSGFDYPMYFEHIMMPDLLPVDGTVDISQPSMDLGNAPFFDATPESVSELDFAAMFDTYKPSHDPQRREANDLVPVQATTTDVPRARLEAFQRSPWLWMPSAQQSAFNEQSHFSINATSVDLVASPETRFGHDATLPDALTYQERDSILLMLKSTVKDRVPISNFPTPDVLTTLVGTCVVKRLRTDQWFHSPTFESRSARTELLAALIAGGCICFGIRDISRTGLLLQEVVRMSLDRLVKRYYP